MSIWAESGSPEAGIRCQVVVVGGGPSGSSAAHTAALHGLNVVLVERGAEHRDKACGDMFVPSAVESLSRLGVNCRALLAGGSATSYDAVDLRGARGLLWRVQYPKEPVWIIPRAVADQALRDALPSSVRVIYRASANEVADISGNKLRVTVSAPDRKELNLQCDAVILATGAQDPLAVRWGIAGNPILAPSISTYVRHPDGALPAFEFIDACRPGYRWMFPAGDGCANLGICALAPSKGSVLKNRGRDLLEAYRLPIDVRWRGGAGALWSGRGACWHHTAGLVSCGDAAGLIDPLNGEGLTAALVSGEAAGNTIAAFLAGNRNLQALRDYSNWVRTTFRSRYAMSPVRIAWKQLCGVGHDRL